MKCDARRTVVRAAVVALSVASIAALSGCDDPVTEPPLPTVGSAARAELEHIRAAILAWRDAWYPACSTQADTPSPSCTGLLDSSVTIAADAAAFYDAVLDHAPGTAGARPVAAAAAAASLATRAWRDGGCETVHAPACPAAAAAAVSAMHDLATVAEGFAP